jgi:hypothetical protein
MIVPAYRLHIWDQIVDPRTDERVTLAGHVIIIRENALITCEDREFEIPIAKLVTVERRLTQAEFKEKLGKLAFAACGGVYEGMKVSDFTGVADEPCNTTGH